jgi:hypothetical protein
MVAGNSRTALFLSHANPDDNAFARWLGAKLAAMGFDVWADVMNLHGGADWARELEEALRTRAIKMLLVASPGGLDKQGVRNEIQIGSDVGKELKDREFIIPLRLAPFSPPFLIAQAQYIDFSKSWAVGLAELLDTLINTYGVPRGAPGSMLAWHRAQSEGSARLIDKPEQLPSNWLRFVELPPTIRYFEPPVGFPLERFQDKAFHRAPVVPHAAGILTFASADSDGFLAPDLPARDKGFIELRTFLRTGWGELHLDLFAARAKFSDLANQAFERLLQGRGLKAYATTGARLRWWGDLRTYPLTQIAFAWHRRKRGRRQIIGQSGKRAVHWHYAVNGQARNDPIPHFRLYAGLIFSANGLDPIDDPKKMHRLRRSFAKWRNARWRDMLLAFLWWLGKGASVIELPISNDQRMRLALPPMIFRSPVSIAQAGRPPPDEDDPEIDYDFGDEDVLAEADEKSDEMVSSS